MSKPTPSISARKADHIDLCISGDVGFKQKTNLFEDIDLIHNALPELSLNDIDLECHFAGKKLNAPLIIAAMTGGVDRATQINGDLASIAEDLGIGFAFGSQRPLLTDGITDGYLVRDQAPSALILGNIGIVQAKSASNEALKEMLKISSPDALCVHLNPAMELVQPEGDQDFTGGLDTIKRLLDVLDVPLIIKETGCGLSRSVGLALRNLGVEWVDVSGAGGTSWVGVETHRAESQQRHTGNCFWDWGIPTAASVLQLQNLNLGICATGGLRNGLQIAKAIALGATCGGIARSFLQAHAEGGKEGAKEAVKQVVHEIRIASLLCGVQRTRDLNMSHAIIGPSLLKWKTQNQK